MLGALSLPTVTTGFSKNSKAMVPVSIQGITDKVQKMSPLESMKEAFFDIRDGIDNLGTIFSEKISGLNEHLAFRFESLNKTLMKIGNIAAKDLGLEQTQTDIVKENEKDEDRDKSLGDKEEGTKGSKLLDTLKERFNSLVDLLSPKSEIAKVGLLGALTLGIVSLLPKLEKAFESIFEFTGEKLIPFLDNMFNIVDDETGKFNWKNILGVGLGAYVASKIVPPLLLGLIFRVPGGARVVGYVALAAWAMGSALAKVGDVVAAQEWTKIDGATDSKLANSIGAALGGNIEGGVMNAFTNASKMAGTFALIGAGIGSVVPVVGTLVGGLIGGAIGLVVGGIMGFFGGGKIAKFLVSISDFVSGAYTKMVNKIRGFFFDEEIGTPDGVYTKRSMLGEVKDVMAADFKLMGENIKDFFYDEEGNLFGINFGALIDMLPSLQDIADKIVKSLPAWMRPDTLKEKIADKKKEIAFQRAQIASGDLKDGFLTDRTDILGKLNDEVAALQIEYNNTFGNSDSTLTGSIVASSNGGDGSKNSIVGNGGGSMVDKMIVVAKARDRKTEEDKLVKQQEALRSLQNINAINNSDNSVVSTAYYGPGLSLEHGPAITALEKLSR